MLFTTYAFAVFLAVLLPAYYLLPKKYRYLALLAGSLFFYAITGGANLCLILVTFLSAYLAARLMGRNLRKQKDYLASHREEMDKAARKAYKAGEKKKRLAILTAALVLNFGLVALLKLNLFSLGNLALWLNSLWNYSSDFALLSLLGLSFYTFQTMGYLIEVYREKTEAEKNPLKLLLFVCFFPLLVQGPICRYGELKEQLYAPHPLKAENLRLGGLRIAWGLFKKLLLAGRVGGLVTLLAASPDRYRGPWFLFLTILYSVKIYADFTGGIDMTIGIARLFGIQVPENFRQPFFSKSTKEYWNRWHISLGNWFTDYLFYPLSVCRPMMSLSTWSRKHLGEQVGKRVPVYLATIVTWFVTGLWHGTAWNFIVWGLLNCLVILVSQELSPLYRAFRKKFPRLTGSGFYAGWEAFRTFLLMGLIRILDVYGNVPLTFRQFFTLFFPSAYRSGENLGETFAAAGLSAVDLPILLGAVLLLFVVSLLSYRRPVLERLRARPVLTLCLFLGVVSLTLLFGRYGYGYDPNAFRYA